MRQSLKDLDGLDGLDDLDMFIIVYRGTSGLELLHGTA